MANDIATYIKYANLQMAAESLFGVQPNDLAGITKGAADMTKDELKLGNNRSSKFPTELANQFINDGWVVVQHKSNTETGFSGTLFQYTGLTDPARGLTHNELVMSIRSTEFLDDAARDNAATNQLELKEFGFAFGQISDMKDWYDSLSGAGGPLAGGQQFALTGYSLGASVATGFNMLMKEAVAGA